jgi:hypothetical protein
MKGDFVIKLLIKKSPLPSVRKTLNLPRFDGHTERLVKLKAGGVLNGSKKRTRSV